MLVSFIQIASHRMAAERGTRELQFAGADH